MNKYAKFNKKSGLYELTLNIKTDMEHFNGEYTLDVHVSAPSSKKLVWQLGALSIWFKEGQDSGTN